MKFGIGIPTCREGLYYPAGFAGPKEMVQVSQMAERLGFYSVWGDDHMTPHQALLARDPQPPNFYELFISLAYIAAATERIKLGAGVIVMPWRDPVLVAKQAATLDVFSGGRLLFAVGIGGSRAEFEAINPRASKGNRGKMLDEGLEVLDLLLNNQDAASYKGRYYEFQDVALYPKPVQRPFPVYLSGTSEEIPRRIAQWGSGCFVAPDVEDIRKRLEALRPLMEERGRSLEEIELISLTNVSIARTQKEAIDRFQRSRLYTQRLRSVSLDRILAANIIGTPAEVIEKINTLKEAGLGQCALQRFAATTFEEVTEQVQMLGEEVLPAFS